MAVQPTHHHHLFSCVIRQHSSRATLRSHSDLKHGIFADDQDNDEDKEEDEQGAKKEIDAIVDIVEQTAFKRATCDTRPAGACGYSRFDALYPNTSYFVDRAYESVWFANQTRLSDKVVVSVLH